MAAAIALVASAAVVAVQSPPIGKELAVPHHLVSGEEFLLTIPKLIEFGKTLFVANWTDQDGAGRPLSKGTGAGLSDPTRPLAGPRGMNRILGPDANSCAGCHNSPFAIAGGSGDITTITFERAERFDFVTFDRKDRTVTRGSVDEARLPATPATVGNQRLRQDSSALATWSCLRAKSRAICSASATPSGRVSHVRSSRKGFHSARSFGARTAGG